MRVLYATKCWHGDWIKFASGAWERKREEIDCIFDGELLVLNNGVPDWFPDTPYSQVRAADTGNPYRDGEDAAVRYAHNNGYDYLCYVQGDCLAEGDWPEKAMEILESDPGTLLVSPASEVNTWHGSDGYDLYCSDQAFVGRVSGLIEAISHAHDYDPDYPEYAQDSFESNVGAYMKATGLKRKILDNYWCVHGTY